jgi:branched-chain amino acid transport system substrate-binding protein
LEWGADVLSRTQDVDDKQQIIDAILATKLTTIGGVIDFTQEIGAAGSTRPVKNSVRLPCPGGQWIKGQKWPFDLVLVEQGLWPDIPVGAKLQPLSAFHSA